MIEYMWESHRIRCFVDHFLQSYKKLAHVALISNALPKELEAAGGGLDDILPARS